MPVVERSEAKIEVHWLCYFLLFTPMPPVPTETPHTVLSSKYHARVSWLSICVSVWFKILCLKQEKHAACQSCTWHSCWSLQLSVTEHTASLQDEVNSRVSTDGKCTVSAAKDDVQGQRSAAAWRLQRVQTWMDYKSVLTRTQWHLVWKSHTNHRMTIQWLRTTTKRLKQPQRDATTTHL